MLRGASRDASRRFDAVVSDGQMPDVDGFALARQIKRDRRLRRTPVIMLTSAGRSDDVARCRRIGIDAYLVKPVKHSDLLDTLVTVFNVSARKAPAKRENRGAKPGPDRALRILVAEDNLVNRKLVTALLKKRGHAVTAVENGRVAVESIDRARRRPFDVVLLDLQMPEMGGFEAAQAIRDREGGSARRLPLIALTAHAMQGDRERCLNAGMDGYLAKPIDVDDLIETVEQFAAGVPPPGAVSDRAAPAASEAVFDERSALSHTGGDRRLLKETIALFRSDCPSYVRRIGSALKRRNGAALRSAAHGLKGALATIGSERGRELAAELEQLGGTRQFEEASGKYVRLRDHLQLLDHAFQTAGFLPSARKRGTHAQNPRRR
jgi:CheY-like chemotaxis protein/HPt (histidine-containing phosphotransfer) domain-containing protein